MWISCFTGRRNQGKVIVTQIDTKALQWYSTKVSILFIINVWIQDKSLTHVKYVCYNMLILIHLLYFCSATWSYTAVIEVPSQFFVSILNMERRITLTKAAQLSHHFGESFAHWSFHVVFPITNMYNTKIACGGSTDKVAIMYVTFWRRNRTVHTTRGQPFIHTTVYFSDDA